MSYISTSGNPISIVTDSEQAAKECIITLEPIQAGTGDPSPSNIRAISGYDSVELTGRGKNLVQIEVGAYNSNGSRQPNSRRARTVNKYLLKAGTYYYSCTPINGKSINAAYMYWANEFDTNNEITYNSGWLGNYNSFTINEDTYVSLLFRYNDESDISINDLKCQLELGSTATTYEPYNPITDYSESLPETVYSATLNVEMGELVVNSKIVDLGDLSWTHRSDVAQGLFSADILTPYKYISNVPMICSYYKYIGTVGSTSEAKNKENLSIVAYYNSTASANSFIVIKDTSYSDASLFKTTVTGQKLVYELATPYNIKLTPAQVRLLQGNNVVTTNGTNIQLTYRNGEVATLTDISSIAESVNSLGNYVNQLFTNTKILFEGNVKTGDTITLSDNINNYRAYKIRSSNADEEGITQLNTQYLTNTTPPLLSAAIVESNNYAQCMVLMNFAFSNDNNDGIHYYCARAGQLNIDATGVTHFDQVNNKPVAIVGFK